MIIKDLSARDNAYGARAIATGLRTGFMNPLERDEWTEKLRSHPHVNIHQRIYADSLSIFKKPDAKPAIVAQLVEFAKNRSITDRAAAAEWLSKNGAPAEALSILPLEEALKRADTFLVWLDTNALLRNFSPCLDALARPENPLPPVRSKLFRALALKQLGRAPSLRPLLQKPYPRRATIPANLPSSLPISSVPMKTPFSRRVSQKYQTNPLWLRQCFRRFIPPC